MEVVITNDPVGHRHILHFIGYQAGRGVDAVGSPRIPNVMEEPLLYRATMEVREIPRQVTSLSHKTQIRREGNKIHLQIEGVHETVIIGD